MSKSWKLKGGAKMSRSKFRTHLISQLEKVYRELLFEKLKIDEVTGLLKEEPEFELETPYDEIKFETFPYIGSKYGETKKILFIGLEVGMEDRPGRIEDFEFRRKSIEDWPLWEHNPHIKGTYFAALFFLKEALNLENYWNGLKKLNFGREEILYSGKLPHLNTLTYVALTNFYKFVKVGSISRKAGKVREPALEPIEENLLVEEVKMFEPDVIIFQGADFEYKVSLLRKLKERVKQIYIGPHPTYYFYKGNWRVRDIIDDLLRRNRP